MKIKLHTWEVFDVDLPKTDHTYDEILSDLTDKDKDSANYLIDLVMELPQLKQIVPYFYDFIFATNYNDAEIWFVKGLLFFPPTYDVEVILFELWDITWWFWIPKLIWIEYFNSKWVIYHVCKIIWEINEFGFWYDLRWIMSWKQIRVVLEKCVKSDNYLDTWNNTIIDVEYDIDDVIKLENKYPNLWDRVIYNYDIPYITE